MRRRSQRQSLGLEAELPRPESGPGTADFGEFAPAAGDTADSAEREGEVASLCFSGGGQTLAAACGDSSVQLWRWGVQTPATFRLVYFVSSTLSVVRNPRLTFLLFCLVSKCDPKETLREAFRQTLTKKQEVNTTLRILSS